MLLLLLAACGTTSSPSSLVRTEVEPPGENCENGGITLSTGTDDDGDGTLGDSEIDTTEFVCDGADGATGADGADGATGADGEDGEDGATALLEMTEEAPGENCAEGGVRVDTGVDDDGDGTLDPDEIDQTEYVCDGATGDVSIAYVSAEPAGANCPYGGQRLDTGVDDDGNGVLDEGEILGTSYVCNGATGGDGAEALVSTAEEPAGANCATGGVAVSVGTDDDGDGALGATEIDTTFYVCDGAAGSGGSGGIAGTLVAGDYTVSNSVEADLLDGVEQITGTLTIYGSSMGDIELPDLVQVGSLYIGNSSYSFTPDSLSLPSLTTVDDNLTISYTSLPDWSGFDSLQTVGGYFSWSYPRGVTTLDAFNGLVSVGGQLALAVGSTSTPPTVIDGFDALTTVGSDFTLGVSTSGTATAVTGFPALTTVGEDFSLSGPTSLTDASGLGGLQTIGGTLSLTDTGLADFSDFSSLTSVGSIYVYYPDALIDFDGLTGITGITGDVTLYSANTLTSLSGLDNLQTIDGSLTISSAAALTSLSGLDRLTTVGGSLTIAYAAALPDVDGLDSLTSVGALLSLYSLAGLTNVDALANLTTAADLQIFSTGLTNLDGLANLDVPDYADVAVYTNTALTDITGLSGIGGHVQYLYIGNNTALTSLAGLEGVTRLGAATYGGTSYALHVSGNTALTDVTGLHNVTAIDYGSNSFSGNTNLCNSAITTLRSTIGTGDILGSWSTSGNKGC